PRASSNPCEISRGIKGRPGAISGPPARPVSAVELIRIEGVSKRYETTSGAVDAVRDVSLAVRRGEFCTIIGPSGCGKSTLLAMVGGLVQPGPLGLRRVAEKYPRELSGGMRQRVAIGRALAVDAQILLMDEPFGALDEQTRMLMGEWLLDIWRRTERTVIFVTHSLHEALALSSRVVVMTARPGRIKSVIELPYGYPRLMESAEIVTLRAKLWSEIRDESLRAMGEA